MTIHQPAQRMAALESAVFAELGARKRTLMAQGVDVIDLGVGTPDQPPAAHIREALVAGVEQQRFGYAISDMTALRQAAADWYARRFAVTLDAETEILAMAGSQDGLAHLPLALINPGDVVLVPDPGYPIFHMAPQMAGGRLVTMPMRRERGWIIDVRDIAPNDARAAKLMVISYPNNPVSVIAPRSFYQDVVAFAREYNITVLHDNAYCELTFDGRTTGSFLQTPGAKEVGLEFNSLSKSHNLTGARVGFALGNA